MATKVAITFAESALSDLQDILSYYNEQGVPHVGEKQVADLINDIELLPDHPDIGRIVPEFQVEYLRELIRPPFRIVYRRDIKKVLIVRIWQSERLLKLP